MKAWALVLMLALMPQSALAQTQNQVSVTVF